LRCTIVQKKQKENYGLALNGCKANSDDRYVVPQGKNKWAIKNEGTEWAIKNEGWAIKNEGTELEEKS